MTTKKNDVLRVALYTRVSTEEQALHGDSLAAQEEELVRVANERGWKIVGIYRDEGNSARKPALKRPVMLELLEDVKRGHIDLIAFIKLDRWFRNVREFHKVQEILDKHRVEWTATMEDYSTLTADARLKLNIMLSVAENEADRTSERIKFVFNSKVQRKEAIWGAQTAPYGYTVKEIDGIKRVVKDKDAEPAVREFFRLMVEQGYSIRNAAVTAMEKHGITRHYQQWYRMAKNELYTGRYNGVEDYCEPYLTAEEFNRVNSYWRPVRKTQNNRVYLFVGLMKCPHCGCKLAGKYTTTGGVEYNYYRCFKAHTGCCDYKSVISEIQIEQYLLDNVRTQMEDLIVQAEVQQTNTKPRQKKSNAELLKEKLRRINVAYFANNMTDEEYTTKTKEIQAQIVAAQAEDKKREAPIDLDAIRALLNTDFESIYKTLSKEERRRLWQTIIAEIYPKGLEVAGLRFK
jgi:DNA invertase Pin-like site-specific DNA recombinase